MIRYKVKLWDSDSEAYYFKKGWCLGTSFEEGARTLEKYYSNEAEEMAMKIFDNYDDELIEDDYLAEAGAEDFN